jgi:hypothetical protein
MRKILLIVGLMVSLLGKGQWSELGGTNSSTFNGIINCLSINSSGSIYAAGGFTNSNGKRYVAMWDGTNWSELGGTNNSTFNNDITCITIDASGNLFVAGNFTNASGKLYVAKWNGSNWSEVGGTNSLLPNGALNSLIADVGGNLYTAGIYVSKWDGINWSGVGSTNNSTFNNSIYSLEIDAVGNLYAAGLFGQNINNNFKCYVAKWDGSSWSVLGGANGFVFNERILSLTKDALGNLYAGGWFTGTNGNYYVAKWNGTSWGVVGSSNNTTLNGSIGNLVTDISNSLYVAGTFANNNGKVYVAKWNGGGWVEVGGTNNSTFNGYLSSLKIDAAGNIYTTGVFTNSNGKYYVAKYTQPLPLKLLSFTAQKENNHVLLNWQTANEVNVSHINVQRSINNKDFRDIGKVNIGVSRYSFLDDKLPVTNDKLTLNYRLEIVDKDGSKTYSEVKQLAIRNEQLAIRIHPNPAKDLVTIECKGAKELLIIDYLGKTVYQSNVDSRPLTVNTKQFAKGVYIVKAMINNGETKTEKLVVE